MAKDWIQTYLETTKWELEENIELSTPEGFKEYLNQKIKDLKKEYDSISQNLKESFFSLVLLNTPGIDPKIMENISNNYEGKLLDERTQYIFESRIMELAEEIKYLIGYLSELENEGKRQTQKNNFEPIIWDGKINELAKWISDAKEERFLNSGIENLKRFIIESFRDSNGNKFKKSSLDTYFNSSKTHTRSKNPLIPKPKKDN